jgi:NAD(P)H-hydrate epimerase
MSVRPLTREEARTIDARAVSELGLPTLVLMENAGRGAAEHVRARLEKGHVLILCGPGNNGGDGGVVARHLDAWGYEVNIIWFAQPAQVRGDAAVQWQVLSKSGINQTLSTGSVHRENLDDLLNWADWVVDGLLGTGLTRPVQGDLRTVIESMNRVRKPILALDLPSGLDADTGQPQGVAVRATVTATFVAPKVGFFQPSAREYTGEVKVVDIGVPRRVLEPFIRP